MLEQSPTYFKGKKNPALNNVKFTMYAVQDNITTLAKKWENMIQNQENEVNRNIPRNERYRISRLGT